MNDGLLYYSLRILQKTGIIVYNRFYDEDKEERSAL